MEADTGSGVKGKAGLPPSGMSQRGANSVSTRLLFEKQFVDDCDHDNLPSPIQQSVVHTPSSKALGHPTFMSSPSPVHKMPGNGMRSELYMKSVLSSGSPYRHRHFTPMSATPAGLSPMFKTPLRQSHNNSPSQLNTPQRTRLPPGYHMCTPQGKLIANPFDLDEMCGPIVMSPGVFDARSTPGSDQKRSFSWAIEHIAELNPVDIEENPKQQDAHTIPDRETEVRVQQAIQNYFSNNLVAPSPWTDPKPKAPVVTTTPNSDERVPKVCLEAELQGSIQKQLPQKSRTVEVGCQTMLTLPVDFDINKLLGQYLTQELSDESNQEMLSTSSLRRKLFFHADTSSLAPSPVRPGGPFEGDHSLVDIGASPKVSPVKYAKLPDNWDQATPLKTPSRNQFSSSPIKNCKGVPPPIQNHTPPGEEFLESPELSPIIHGHQSRILKSRSSGRFVPHEGSFGEDDIFSGLERKALFTQELPPSPEISPIKAQIEWEVSPEEGRHPSRTSLESPGISPIRSDSSYSKDNGEGSFLLDHQDFTSEEESDQDVITPVASKENSVKKKGVSSRKISHLSRHKHRTSLFQEDLDDTPMDYESAPAIKNLRFADDIRTSSLLFNTKEFSLAEMDYSHDNNAVSANQDTGYQTASLQSTNQEMGLHTNLTSQFISLSNQDTSPSDSMSYPGSSSVDIGKHDHPQRVVTVNDSALGADSDSCSKDMVQQLLDLTNLEKFEHEDEILERARQALAMANKLLPDINDMQSSGDSLPQKGLQILYELEPIVTPVGKSSHTSVLSSTKSDSLSASEKALVILRRAGEDLAKYGDLWEQKA